MIFTIVAGGYALIGLLGCCIVEGLRKAIVRRTIIIGWRGKERESRLNERD